MNETKLQLLLDRMEISDVVIRYCVSADMRDWEGHLRSSRMKLSLTTLLLTGHQKQK